MCMSLKGPVNTGVCTLGWGWGGVTFSVQIASAPNKSVKIANKHTGLFHLSFVHRFVVNSHSHKHCASGIYIFVNYLHCLAALTQVRPWNIHREQEHLYSWIFIYVQLYFAFSAQFTTVDNGNLYSHSQTRKNLQKSAGIVDYIVSCFEKTEWMKPHPLFSLFHTQDNRNEPQTTSFLEKVLQNFCRTVVMYINLKNPKNLHFSEEHIYLCSAFFQKDPTQLSQNIFVTKYVCV